jgi:hypothetical protein
MVMYATPTELAGRLEKDLDTYTATQALTLASAEFSAAADTWFSSTSVTWTASSYGCTELELPYYPVTAVSAVRVNGVTVTGWSLRNGTLYRSAGFGYRYSWPPDVIDVDLTHGYTSVPDDVKRAVLDMAAADYDNPTKVASEQVDDYRITYYNGTPIAPSGRPWAEVAASYRGLLVA